MKLWSWIRGPEVRPEVEPRLQRVALDRVRVFAPIAALGVLIGLLVSLPVGIDLPSNVLTVRFCGSSALILWL